LGEACRRILSRTALEDIRFQSEILYVIPNGFSREESAFLWRREWHSQGSSTSTSSPVNPGVFIPA
jgi:hypothetical protein